MQLMSCIKRSWEMLFLINISVMNACGHTVLCAESRITMSVIVHLSDSDRDRVEKTVESLHAVLFISPRDECVY